MNKIVLGVGLLVGTITKAWAQTGKDASATSAAPLTNSFAVEAEEMKNRRAFGREAYEITTRIRSMKSISNEEVERLITVIIKPGQAASIQTIALKSLGWLRPNQVTMDQFEKIAAMLIYVVQQDDRKSDPDGSVKAYAADAASATSKDRRLIPVFKTLLNDPRPSVRIAVENTLRYWGYKVGSETVLSKDEAIAEMQRLQLKVRGDRGISNKDLDHAIAIATKADQRVDVRVEAVKVLLYPNRQNLELAKQWDKVVGLVKQLAEADDAKTDPEGKLKVTLCGVAFSTLQDKRLIPVFQALQQNDGRKLVRSAAEETVAAIRYAER